MKNLFFLIGLLISSSLFAQQDTSSQLSLLGNWDIDSLPASSGVVYNDIWGYVDCEGREYAIIGTTERIYFLDITDPANIREMGHFNGGQRTIWRDIKTYRDRAYAVSDDLSEGLMIFDLSNIQDTIIKTYQSNTFFNAAHNIYIEEQHGRMYVVGTNVEDMFVYDIATDPDNPIELAGVSLPGGEYVHDVYVRDNIAYCSHGYQGYYVWDMTDPSDPIRMAALVTGAYNHSSWLTDDGKYAFYAEEVPIGQPLGIINLERKEDRLIELEKTFKAPLLAPDFTRNRPHNPFIRGDYLVVSYYHDGVVIFDISDPLNPVRTAFYDTTPNTNYPDDFQGVWGVYPFFSSGKIIASDVTRGLFVLSADSIDWQPVTPVVNPDVSIETAAVLPLCEGSEAELSVAPGADSYEWFKDGVPTGDSLSMLVVEAAGTYTVKATKGHCSAQSEPFDIAVNPLPDIAALSADSIQFCEGSSSLLEAPDSLDFYLWMKNGEVVSQDGNTYEVVDSGAYVLIAYLDGCASTSEPIRVDLYSLPSAELNLSDTSFCSGEIATIAVPAGAASYVWTADSLLLAVDSNAILVEQSGTYSVQVSSLEGCEVQSEMLNLVFNTPVIPQITMVDDELRSSPALSYQWLLNGAPIMGAVGQFYVIEESGLYQVETVDANGCTGLSEGIEAVFTSVVDGFEGVRMLLAPNPTGGWLNVELKLVKPAALELMLTDLSGRQLYYEKLPMSTLHQSQLNLNRFTSGLYLLHLNSAEGKIVKKIVKH
ncbi:MAG: choice-of-anchor B family protein [Bacteroidota bacterium]